MIRSARVFKLLGGGSGARLAPRRGVPVFLPDRAVPGIMVNSKTRRQKPAVAKAGIARRRSLRLARKANRVRANFKRAALAAKRARRVAAKAGRSLRGKKPVNKVGKKVVKRVPFSVSHPNLFGPKARGVGRQAAATASVSDNLSLIALAGAAYFIISQ